MIIHGEGDARGGGGVLAEWFFAKTILNSIFLSHYTPLINKAYI